MCTMVVFLDFVAAVAGIHTCMFFSREVKRKIQSMLTASIHCTREAALFYVSVSS